MNKKGGFTLIELLAVIVILAIIALIATPIVLNIISDTKESSSLRSADFYLDALELSIAQAVLDSNSITDGTYNILENGNICLEDYNETTKACDDNDSNLDNNELKVEVNGEKPSRGTITITNGNISDLSIVLNEKTIIKNSEGKLVYQDAPTGPTLALCNYQNNEFAEKTVGAKYSCDFGGGARNFYILELGSNKVEGSLLKDDEVALILEGNYGISGWAWCDQEGANPDYNSCNADGLTSALDEIAEDWSELDREQIVLPSALQIIVANDPTKNTIYYATGIQSWLYSWDNSVWGDQMFGYWTSTPRAGTSDSAWYVYYGGQLCDNYVYDGAINGVRPVVNLKI